MISKYLITLSPWWEKNKAGISRSTFFVHKYRVGPFPVMRTERIPMEFYDRLGQPGSLIADDQCGKCQWGKCGEMAQCLALKFLEDIDLFKKNNVLGIFVKQNMALWILVICT